MEKNVYKLYSYYCDSSKSMEGDHGKNRLPRCLLTSFQNGAQHNFSFKKINSASKLVNWIIVDILKVSSLITEKFIVTHFYLK